LNYRERSEERVIPPSINPISEIREKRDISKLRIKIAALPSIVSPTFGFLSRSRSFDLSRIDVARRVLTARVHNVNLRRHSHQDGRRSTSFSERAIARRSSNVEARLQNGNVTARFLQRIERSERSYCCYYYSFRCVLRVDLTAKISIKYWSWMDTEIASKERNLVRNRVLSNELTSNRTCP